MSTTSRHTSTGSRTPWSGLVDVLLGRTPARNAGFFHRSAETVERPTDEQSADEHQQPVPASGADRADDTPSSPTTDGDGSDGLQVRTDRVSLDAELGVGAVDGAWWPRSDRAPDEVGELVEALPDQLGRVTRIALSMDDWGDDRRRVVHVDGHPRHLAWFAGLRRHTAHLTFEGGGTAVLLVLPPGTEESAAREVLEAVGGERSRQELLTRAGVDSEEPGTSAQDHQQDDGTA